MSRCSVDGNQKLPLPAIRELTAGTIHPDLLDVDFVASTTIPCLYSLKDGKVLLFLYVDDILISGQDKIWR